MGFIKIEKDNKVNNKYIKDFSKELSTKDSYNDSNINYPKTPDVSLSENIDTAKNNGLYSEASITNLNNNDTKEYSYNFSDNSGMNGDELKVERDLVSTCGLTFIKIIIFTAVILGLLYLGFGYLDSKVSLFPYQSSYTAKEFNEYLRRSFLLMFLILSFGCSLVMVIITNIVTKEFKRNYLSKLNVYIYDVFTVLLNVLVYTGGGWLMFKIVNNLYDKFLLWQTAGTIVGNVNIETINIFKYVVTSVIAVFIVINAFAIVEIVHKNHKFVFENV